MPFYQNIFPAPYKVKSREGNHSLTACTITLADFFLSIVADIIAHYICKWWDDRK